MASGTSASSRHALAMACTAAGGRRARSSTVPTRWVRSDRASASSRTGCLGSSGCQQHQRLARGVGGEVFEHFERLAVGPVQVLQHEQAASARATHHPQQANDRFAEQHQRVLNRWRVGLTPIRNEPRQDLQERPKLGSVAREPVAPKGRQQRLGDRSVGHRRAAFDASAPQHAQPTRLSQAVGFASQARLADTGLAQHHDAAATAVARRLRDACSIVRSSSSRPMSRGHSTCRIVSVRGDCGAIWGRPAVQTG